MKLVINKCYGGFGVSRAVYGELGIVPDDVGILPDHQYLIGEFKDYAHKDDIDFRSDSDLIAAIERIGCEAASGTLAELKIIEIPDDVEVDIYEHDGLETVHEVHRAWG